MHDFFSEKDNWTQLTESSLRLNTHMTNRMHSLLIRTWFDNWLYTHKQTTLRGVAHINTQSVNTPEPPCTGMRQKFTGVLLPTRPESFVYESPRLIIMSLCMEDKIAWHILFFNERLETCYSHHRSGLKQDTLRQRTRVQ